MDDKEKQLIVYEVGTKTIVNAIASKIGCKTMFDLSLALKKADEIDANTVGLVFKQEGKGISTECVEFIKTFFSKMDLNKLQYLYVCVIGPEKPYYSLKAVEKLCHIVGCAPSYSHFIDESDRADAIKMIAQGVNNKDIKLAVGSIGTYIYMKLNHIG